MHDLLTNRTVIVTGAATGVGGMNLENLLGQVQTDGGNLLHGTAPFVWACRTDTPWHSDAGSGGAVPPHQLKTHRVGGEQAA